MAENKKPRTNWSDKARRITGAVTLLVIVLAIILAVSLSKGKAKKSEVTSVITAPVTVTETKVEVKEEKTPEPVAEVKVEEPVVVPAAPEPVVVEAAVEEPVVEEKAEVVAVPETASFSVFGINVDNQWYNGSFTASVREKGVVTTAEMFGFLRYEIDKYGQEISALISGVKFAQDSVSFRYVSSIDPEGLLPVLKRDIEEYILKFFVPKSVEKVETPVVAEEVAVVEEPAPEPVVEEKKAETASFSVFGYGVENSWIDGKFTSLVEKKGVVSENDVRGFVLYEIAKYGDLLLANTSVKFVADGFVLTYPEEYANPSDYMAAYKADLEEYILTLFAPVEEKKAETASFSVFGYRVENSWIDGKFTSLVEKKGVVSEDDVRGFVLYEIAKYGDFLLANTSVEFVADGFVLTYPAEYADPSDYLATYKSDLEEYILMLFAPSSEPVQEEAPVEVVVEEPAPVETPVVAEEPAPAEPKIPSAVEDIMVSVVTDKVQEVVEGADVKSASAAKIASFDVSASLGLDFGVKSGRSYNPTIFPRLALSAEFRNMFSIGSIGVGVRMDGAINFLPLDGTFVGHDMAYLTKTTNWGMDATLDWKVMFSKDFGSTSLYFGAGVGYSLASNLPSITSHSGAMSFGFKTSVVATGVVGVQWMLSDTFFLSLEGQGRYFIQSGEYAFGSSMRMGWRF